MDVHNGPQDGWDDDPDREYQRGHEPPPDPADVGDLIAEEFRAYLDNAGALDPYPAPTPGPQPGAARPALRLVKPEPDHDAEVAALALDPGELAAAGKAARRRMVRGAAGGSAVVVAAGALVGWGQPLVVTGPLAVYGTGWVAYLWWNAALRPPIPAVLHGAADRVSAAVAAVFALLATLARALRSRAARSTSPEADTEIEPTPATATATERN